jgi:hypothetical protein
MNQILATHVSPVNEISFGKFFTEKEGEWPKISRHGLADA